MLIISQILNNTSSNSFSKIYMLVTQNMNFYVRTKSTLMSFIENFFPFFLSMSLSNIVYNHITL